MYVLLDGEQMQYCYIVFSDQTSSVSPFFVWEGVLNIGFIMVIFLFLDSFWENSHVSNHMISSNLHNSIVFYAWAELSYLA